MLALCTGSLAELERLVNAARVDYRDVLMWAEKDTSPPAAVHLYVHDAGGDGGKPTVCRPADHAALRLAMQDSAGADLTLHARSAIGATLTGFSRAGRGMLVYQHPGDRTGFATLDVDYRGPDDAACEFTGQDGARVRFPARWTLPTDDVLAAFGFFVSEGAAASWLQWSHDGVIPSDAVFWSRDIARSQALAVVDFYSGLSLTAGLPSAQLVELFQERHGRYADSSSCWDDLLLLALTDERVWAEDASRPVGPDRQTYADLLQEWSAISLGKFAPTAIMESWTGPEGPVELRFKIQSRDFCVRPCSVGTHIDYAILESLNAAMAESTRRFCYSRDGDLVIVLYLTAEERASMVSTRGFPFAEASGTRESTRIA